MITNGRLIVLLSQTPSSLSPGDDLSKLHDFNVFRQYFGISGRVTNIDDVCIRAKDSDNHHTIVVVEKGFFSTEDGRVTFRKQMEDFGVPLKHILFGEDYASGYHHIILKIHELCE